MSPIHAITRQYFACIDKCNENSESWISFSEGSVAERSKAPDSRHCFAPLIESCENSGPRMRAWVQIPLLTNKFFLLIYAIEGSLGVSPIHTITRQYFTCLDKCNENSESWLSSQKVAWPSGLRRWFKAPVSSGAWVRIPPLPQDF